MALKVVTEAEIYFVMLDKQVNSFTTLKKIFKVLPGSDCQELCNIYKRFNTEKNRRKDKFQALSGNQNNETCFFLF